MAGVTSDSDHEYAHDPAALSPFNPSPSAEQLAALLSDAALVSTAYHSFRTAYKEYTSARRRAIRNLRIRPEEEPQQATDAVIVGYYEIVRSQCAPVRSPRGERYDSGLLVLSRKLGVSEQYELMDSMQGMGALCEHIVDEGAHNVTELELDEAVSASHRLSWPDDRGCDCGGSSRAMDRDKRHESERANLHSSEQVKLATQFLEIMATRHELLPKERLQRGMRELQQRVALAAHVGR